MDESLGRLQYPVSAMVKFHVKFNYVMVQSNLYQTVLLNCHGLAEVSDQLFYQGLQG